MFLNTLPLVRLFCMGIPFVGLLCIYVFISIIWRRIVWLPFAGKAFAAAKF